jgi:hypothetical protein
MSSKMSSKMSVKIDRERIRKDAEQWRNYSDENQGSVGFIYRLGHAAEPLLDALEATEQQAQRLLDAARATLDDEDVLELYQMWEIQGDFSFIVPYYAELWRKKLALWRIVKEYDNEQTPDADHRA